jgi:hypothetical protein
MIFPEVHQQLHVFELQFEASPTGQQILQDVPDISQSPAEQHDPTSNLVPFFFSIFAEGTPQTPAFKSFTIHSPLQHWQSISQKLPSTKQVLPIQIP